MAGMTNDQPVRIGDWMQTYTGLQFWPLDPRPSEISITQLAPALSLLCRYGRHTTRFYSVAEHCCHVHDFASPQNKLWALLHDASEAYIADIIRPIKPYLPGYKDAERKVMRAVCERFGLYPEEPVEVSVLDKRILGDEAAQVMSHPPEKWYYIGEPLHVTIQGWLPAQAEAEFLDRFCRLAKEPTP